MPDIAKNPTTDKIPQAIWEGVFTVAGCRLRCYILDDGQRIINAEDMIDFLSAMGDEPETADEEELMRFALWSKGGKL